MRKIIAKRATVTLLALSLSCLFVTKSAAVFFSGNELWGECKAPSPSNVCLGFVAGAIDMFVSVHQSVGDKTVPLCIPPDVQLEQAVDTVKLWLQEHPEQRHYRAVTVVAAALKEKFPCN